MLRTINSFRISFWIVPPSLQVWRPAPVRYDIESHNGKYGSIHGHDTDILFNGIPSKSTFIFSTEQMDTPALPTSPTTRSLSGSVSTVCRKVERYRKTFLTTGQVTAINALLFCCRESGILTDCPPDGKDTSLNTDRAGTEEVRLYSRGVPFLPGLLCINWFYVYLLWSFPIGAMPFAFCQSVPFSALIPALIYLYFSKSRPFDSQFSVILF